MTTSTDPYEDIPKYLFAALMTTATADDLPGFKLALARLLMLALPHHTSVTFCHHAVLIHDRQGIVTKGSTMQRSAISARYLFPFNGQVIPASSQCVALEDFLSIKDLHAFGSAVREHEWHHALVIPLWVDGSAVAATMLYRGADQERFTEQDVLQADHLRVILEQVAHTLFHKIKQHAVRDNLVEFLQGFPVGIVMLDWLLHPIFINDEAIKQTRIWARDSESKPTVVDSDGEFKLPNDLYALCSELLNNWLFHSIGFEIDNAPVDCTQQIIKGSLRASITVSYRRDTPYFLIRYFGLNTRVDNQFQPSPAQLKLLVQLTPAERNIALLVMQGLSNQEIAHKLHREISTVKDHLTHIFDKLDIRSRVQLASLLSQQ